MPISEAQFKQMTKGTVHEGRYDAPIKKSATKLHKAKSKSTKHVAPPIECDSIYGADKLADSVHKAIPAIVAINLFTNPIAWLIVLVLAAPMGYITFKLLSTNIVSILLAIPIIFAFAYCIERITLLFVKK